MQANLCTPVEFGGCTTNNNQSFLNGHRAEAPLITHKQRIISFCDVRKEKEDMLQTNEGTKNESSTAPQYVTAFTASLLVFSGGSVIGWSSPALHMFDQANSTLPFQPTASEASCMSSLLTIGALIGALPAGTVADMIGRKLSMLLLSAPLLASWGMIIFGGSVPVIYAARLTAGIGLGAICTIVPLYIAEIAESNVRGVLGSLFQLMICSGILFTYIIGAVTSYHKMAAMCSTIPVVFIFAFMDAPETPVYLLRRGRRSEAEKSLKSLRGISFNTSKELDAMESELNKSAAQNTLFLKALARRETKLAVVISLGMMIFQQLSGINIVIFYSSKIFDSAGSKLDSEVCTILVGLAQAGATLAMMFFIDKTGRKILLQISATSMAICLGVLGWYFHQKDSGVDVSSLGLIPVVAVLTYILLFSIGFGPIPWMMSGEVLSDDIKGVCTGIAVSLNWTLAFVVTFTFQFVVNAIGSAGTYWILSGICAIATIFVTFVVVETKGKSLQQIQDELAGKKLGENVVV